MAKKTLIDLSECKFIQNDNIKPYTVQNDNIKPYTVQNDNIKPNYDNVYNNINDIKLQMIGIPTNSNGFRNIHDVNKLYEEYSPKIKSNE